MSGLGDDAQALLKASEGGDEPTAEDRARVKAALLAAIGPAGSAPSGRSHLPGPKGAAPSVAGAGAKALLAVVVIGAAGAALWLAGPSAPQESAPAAPVEAPVAPFVANVEESPEAIERAPERAAEDLPNAEQAPPKAHAASAGRVEPSLSANKPPAPAEAAAAPPPGPESTLAEETRRLRAAHKAMQDGNADAALAMLEEQEAKFSGGELAEERAAARVIALCELGRAAEGQAAAEHFLREHPRSPLADRVRAACGP